MAKEKPEPTPRAEVTRLREEIVTRRREALALEAEARRLLVDGDTDGSIAADSKAQALRKAIARLEDLLPVKVQAFHDAEAARIAAEYRMALEAIRTASTPEMEQTSKAMMGFARSLETLLDAPRGVAVFRDAVARSLLTRNFGDAPSPAIGQAMAQQQTNEIAANVKSAIFAGPGKLDALLRGQWADPSLTKEGQEAQAQRDSKLSDLVQECQQLLDISEHIPEPAWSGN